MSNQIKVGDKVRIINPQIFVRCGYPLCISDVAKTIDQKIIIDCLVQCGVYTFEQLENLIKYHPYHKMQRAYRKILDGIALAVMVSKGFGGSERKIYTREIEEFRDKIVQVESKRQVVTGDRYPGCGPGYYGDEAEGPSLENQVRHTLITFIDPSSVLLSSKDFYKEIEISNVERVIEESKEVEK